VTETSAHFKGAGQSSVELQAMKQLAVGRAPRQRPLWHSWLAWQGPPAPTLPTGALQKVDRTPGASGSTNTVHEVPEGQARSSTQRVADGPGLQAPCSQEVPAGQVRSTWKLPLMQTRLVCPLQLRLPA
jgi:hypothetical protein